MPVSICKKHQICFGPVHLNEIAICPNWKAKWITNNSLHIGCFQFSDAWYTVIGVIRRFQRENWWSRLKLIQCSSMEETYFTITYLNLSTKCYHLGKHQHKCIPLPLPRCIKERYIKRRFSQSPKNSNFSAHLAIFSSQKQSLPSF